MKTAQSVYQQIKTGSACSQIGGGIWLFCLALFCIACDGAGVGEESGPNRRQSITLTPSGEVELSFGTVSVFLDNRSILSQGEWHYDPDNPELFSTSIAAAGLWMAADQGGPRSNIAYPFSRTHGFDFVTTESDIVGIFVITKDSLRAPDMGQ